MKSGYGGDVTNEESRRYINGPSDLSVLGEYGDAVMAVAFVAAGALNFVNMTKV